MQSLQSVIEQLDIRRAQVHVEALIVEVAEGSNINFGVQWGVKRCWINAVCQRYANPYWYAGGQRFLQPSRRKVPR